eukprot:12993888-Alexandrium_andersonii.AAC.1
MKHYHNREDKVDSLIKSKTAAKLVQPHPDFPKDKDMLQYKCHEFTKYTHTNETAHTKALHWTALVT